MTAEYRRATRADLEALWARSIRDNPGDPRYIRWRDQFIRDNASGAAATFAVIIGGEPVGEGTLLLTPECRAVRGRQCLADGKTTANINALRIRAEFEGQGHISQLVRLMEHSAREMGCQRITIGVEESAHRSRAIYAHWNYVNLVLKEYEDGEQVLYFAKDL